MHKCYVATSVKTDGALQSIKSNQKRLLRTSWPVTESHARTHTNIRYARPRSLDCLNHSSAQTSPSVLSVFQLQLAYLEIFAKCSHWQQLTFYL